MSSRQRKKVNYKQFVESDSDDDFVEDAPPVKKARKESKKNPPPKQPPCLSSESNPQTNKTSSVATKRLSRDEKAFNRELQQALTVSVGRKSLTTSEANTETHAEIAKSKDSVKNLKPVISKEEGSSDYSAATSEEESGGSSDSEFSSTPLAKKQQQGKKPRPLKSKSTPVAPTSAKDVAAKCSPRALATQARVATPTTPALGGRRMPKWTPPALAGTGKSTTISSPQVASGGTPVIRLGLSRNARLKPLHSKTKPPS